MSSLMRTVSAFSVGVAAVGAAYGYHEKTQVDAAQAQTATVQGQIAECNKAKDAAQAAKEKAMAEAAATLDASRTELDELRAEHAQAEKQLEAFKSLTDRFKKMIDSGKLTVILRNGRMVVKLRSDVLFDSGSAELSKEGKDALREVAGVLRQVPDRRFMVAGHTDNMPVVQPSQFKNNLDLSTQRALVVAQHLTVAGVPARRLVAAGYAEHEPVRPNTSNENRHENRRIEIVLLPNVTDLMAGDAGAGDGGASDAGHDASAADSGKK